MQFLSVTDEDWWDSNIGLIRHENIKDGKGNENEREREEEKVSNF